MITNATQGIDLTSKKKTDVEVIADKDLDRAVGGAGDTKELTTAEKEDSYYEYELKNVEIKSFSTSGSGD